MAENEKINEELERVSGGIKSVDDCPTVEYTCPKCGCKYTHKNPGKATNASATLPKCPQCEGGILSGLKLDDCVKMLKMGDLEKVSGGLKLGELFEKKTKKCRMCGKDYDGVQFKGALGLNMSSSAGKKWAYYQNLCPDCAKEHPYEETV